MSEWTLGQVKAMNLQLEASCRAEGGCRRFFVFDLDRLIDEEKISCFWEKPGRFVGAWTKKHFDAQTRRLAILNAAAQSGAASHTLAPAASVSEKAARWLIWPDQTGMPS